MKNELLLVAGLGIEIWDLVGDGMVVKSMWNDPNEDVGSIFLISGSFFAISCVVSLWSFGTKIQLLRRIWLDHREEEIEAHLPCP